MTGRKSVSLWVARCECVCVCVCMCVCVYHRLFQNDLKESGVLPVLSKCAKTFKPKKQAHSYAEDIIVVSSGCVTCVGHRVRM